MAYLIKRYPNRKLYDVQESRYVTLEDLGEMINAGREVSVADASTGEDLTATILTEILLERARSRGKGLPAAFLSQLIRHGEAWEDFVQRSLRASLQGVITSQRQFDRIFREWATQAGLLQTKTRARRSPARPRRRRR